MKVLKNEALSILRSIDGKVLKIRPDDYVEPLPDAFMVQVAVEEGQTLTLPTPNNSTVISYVDLWLDVYTAINGTLLGSNDNTGGNYQPSLSLTLAANTEYYIKITASPVVNAIIKEGLFNIVVTGNGTAIPTAETGVTSLTVGTLLTAQYLEYQGTNWFKFKTTAAGNYTMRTYGGTIGDYNYNVDWSDGTVTTGITTWNSSYATHTYTTKGTYVIYITGSMPGWSVNNSSNMRLLITKCISWGNVGLKNIDFYGCTAMTTIPDQLSKLPDVFSFANFCNGCTSLVGIPYGTFFGTTEKPILKTTSFSYAFYNCQSLRTIYSSTFRDVQNCLDFSYTFAGCIKLLAIPDLLFYNCYRVTTWKACFTGLTSITEIPGDLFLREKHNTDYENIATSSFEACFSGCTGVSTLPAELFSSQQLDNLGVNKVKGTSFSGTFASCSLLNNLPSHIFHNQIYATTIAGAFYNCDSLVNTPVSCFEGCINVTNAGQYQVYTSVGITYIYTYGVFGSCANLKTVTDNCFKECYAVTTYDTCFYDNPLLDTLCSNIFHDSPLVTSFYRTFGFCPKLSSWFSDPNTNNYQIDPELFVNNINVTNFSWTFQSCTSIKDLPEILFETCTAVTTFNGTFYNCTYLKAIPPLLFRYNVNTLTFASTFYNCTSLTKIPTMTVDNTERGLFYFNPLVKSFYNTFNSCRLSNDMDIDGITILVPAIPAITFLGNTEVTGTFTGNADLASFYGTFGNNPNLQSIPDELFINNIKATDFSNVFASCTNAALTSVPANLFIGNQNVEIFYNSFGTTKLTSIPDTLFQSCVRVSNFSYCFSSTNITEIPTLLFSYSAGTVQNFSYTFYNCAQLTKINIDVFKENFNVTNFANCFRLCTSLTDIPQDLFKYNIINANFSYTFYGCSSLVDPKLNIFKYNLGVVDFSYAFGNCNRIKLEQTMFSDLADKATRFLNKSINFTRCFERSAMGLIDLYMSYYTVYNGTAVANDDNSGGESQPKLTRTLLANTEYYIKIKNNDSRAGYFGIIVTGNGTAVPTTEAGIISLIVGTEITDISIASGQEIWFKFKTTAAGSYVFYTTPSSINIQGTAPDLWNYTFNFTPTKTICFGGAGNNIYTLSNYNDIPTDWKT